jgi:hypothetical protein
MPIEDWVRHSRHDMFLYDWQTLIAGGLALLAGIGTVAAAIGAIWVTRSTAKKQIDASREEADKVIDATRPRPPSRRSKLRRPFVWSDDALRAKAMRSALCWKRRWALSLLRRLRLMTFLLGNLSRDHWTLTMLGRASPKRVLTNCDAHVSNMGASRQLSFSNSKGRSTISPYVLSSILVSKNSTASTP